MSKHINCNEGSFAEFTGKSAKPSPKNKLNFSACCERALCCLLRWDSACSYVAELLVKDIGNMSESSTLRCDAEWQLSGGIRISSAGYSGKIKTKERCMSTGGLCLPLRGLNFLCGTANHRQPNAKASHATLFQWGGQQWKKMEAQWCIATFCVYIFIICLFAHFPHSVALFPHYIFPS